MYETLTVFAGELANRKIEDHWETCGLDDFIDAFYDSIKDARIDYFETLERTESKCRTGALRPATWSTPTPNWYAPLY